MKRNNLIALIAVLIALISIIYSFVGTEDAVYEKEIQKHREETDLFMRTSPNSPFTGKMENYMALSYFPPDIKYRIKAKLVAVENKKAVVLPTSDGKTKRYMEYAYAEFKLEGMEHRLLVLEIADIGPFRGELFLAFGDETSAGETYGAGRYLNVTKPRGGRSIVLDFNKAYNPYCAYNEKFSCPLPPQENLLMVPIKAGEKTYP